MPKATVNENDFTAWSKDEVRFSRKIAAMEAVTIAEGVDEAANLVRQR